MLRQWLRLLDPTILEMQNEPVASPGSRLRLARALNGRCMHEEARGVVENALSVDGNDPDLWFERIMALGDHASAEEMEDLYRRLAGGPGQPKDSAPVLRNLGFLRVLQQRGDEAERTLRRSLALDGADPRALELMGLLCVQRDNCQEAKTWLLKALTLQPRDPRTLRLLGITCEHLGDFKCAESQFLAALEVDPCYFWGWHSLGELLIKQGEMADGLRCIYRARSIQRQGSSQLLHAFRTVHRAGAPGAGHGRAAPAHRLGAAPGRAGGGLCHARRNPPGPGRPGGRHLATSPWRPRPTPRRPTRGRPWGTWPGPRASWEEALRCYREALTRKPDAADLQVQMGYILLNSSQYQEGEQLFLTALEADPGEYSAYLGLSECYRNLQRPEDQLAMVKQAMALAPEDPDVWNAMGVALEVRGPMRGSHRGLREGPEPGPHAPQGRQQPGLPAGEAHAGGGS